MSDKKAYLGAASVILYVAGFLAVQAHLLRYGILEISPLQAYYLMVGFWFFLVIAPSIIAVLAAEYGLCSSDPRRVKLLVLVTIFALLVATVTLFSRYTASRQVFNFNAYPYPSCYMFRAVGFLNLAVFLGWLACFGFSRMRALRSAARKVSTIAAGVVVAISVLFFGRIVYPALDHGVGGGAPQFVIVDLKSERFAALNIYSSGQYLYLLPLDSIPDEFYSRTAEAQFVEDINGPVYNALSRGTVLKLSANMVHSTCILSLGQKKVIDYYLQRRGIIEVPERPRRGTTNPSAAPDGNPALHACRAVSS